MDKLLYGFSINSPLLDFLKARTAVRPVKMHSHKLVVLLCLLPAVRANKLQNDVMVESVPATGTIVITEAADGLDRAKVFGRALEIQGHHGDDDDDSDDDKDDDDDDDDDSDDDSC